MENSNELIGKQSMEEERDLFRTFAIAEEAKGEAERLSKKAAKAQANAVEEFDDDEDLDDGDEDDEDAS